MRTPTIRTSMRVATMKEEVTTIRMNTITISTTSKDSKLLVSTPATPPRAGIEETRKRALRPSATSP